VKSVPDAKRFYGGAFGWKFEDYGPDYASFADGRLSGGFQTAAKVQAGGPLVVIYAADLENMEQRVRQAGGTIVKPIFSFPGGRRFHFTDPSGNELAVWSDNGETRKR
jgi:predicted enzyme related to lactoylglutathione lyase